MIFLKKFILEASTAARQTNPVPLVPASHVCIRSGVPLRIDFPVYDLGKQQTMAQILGPLHPRGSLKEPQFPDFGLAKLQSLWQAGM